MYAALRSRPTPLALRHDDAVDAPHEWMLMGIPGTGSLLFRQFFLKGGDGNAPQDRVERQREADVMEGEHQTPELKRTKTVTVV
jgi:hypothetical protein